jgi:hypothetical protein
MTEESTTSDLVELTRTLLTLGEAGARSRGSQRTSELDAGMSSFSPRRRVRNDPCAWSGLPGSRGDSQGHADWFRSFGYIESELEAIAEVGRGIVLTVIRNEAFAVRSGATVRQREAHVWVSEDGLVTHVANYTDIDEARAVAERLVEERG